MYLKYLANFLRDKVNSIISSLQFIQLTFIILRNDISTFNDKNMEDLKNKVIQNGPISLKFMQWYLTKKNMDNEDGQYDNIINKFDNIFDNCPFHSLDTSKKMFLNDYGMDMSEVIDLDSIKEIGSGSIGQVYKANLLDGSEVAIKIKHPNILGITSGQFYVINTFIYLQKIKWLKNLLHLHIDIEDFMYNLLLQLDFTNESFNTLKFSKYLADNELVIVPKVLYYSKDTIISEYQPGEDFDSISLYNKSKVGLNFYCLILKMNLFLDYTHGDLHKKNWKVRKCGKDYKIVLYDFGLVFTTHQVDNNRLLWHSFETNNTEGVLKCLPHMLVTDDKKVPKIPESLTDAINEIFAEKCSSSNIVNSLIQILNKEKLYINRTFLNILIVITLIENVFVEIDFVNRYDPPNMDKRLRNITSRYGDIYAFCKKYSFYGDVEEYVKEEYNKYQIENLFVNYNSKLEFDSPLDLDDPLSLDDPLTI